MRMVKKVRIMVMTLCGALAALSAWPCDAQAHLGGDESTLAAVRVALASRSESIIDRGTHQIHELAVGNGVVRAYVAPSGQIFAYTGHGVRNHPDPTLLGSYLAEYQAAVRSYRRSGRRPLSVRTANLVAAITGPQGNLHWAIYLKALPSGVSENDIH